MPDKHGQFVWYDLISPDPAGSIDFYTHVAGWGTQHWNDMNYTMWENAGAPIGGVVKSGGPMGDRPNWLPYVAVDNVDATAEKAKQLGGKILSGPADISETGRYAILQDPQGAAIAIFTSTSSTPASDYNPKPGLFSWHELTTSDHKAAFEFYKSLFGWNATGDFDMGAPMGVYQMYGKGAVPYGGMFTKPAEMPMPTSWLSYIMVADLDEATERAKSRGAQMMQEPIEVPGGDRVATFVDPQGAMFALHSRPAT